MPSTIQTLSFIKLTAGFNLNTLWVSGAAELKQYDILHWSDCKIICDKSSFVWSGVLPHKMNDHSER